MANTVTFLFFNALGTNIHIAPAVVSPSFLLVSNIFCLICFIFQDQFRFSCNFQICGLFTHLFLQLYTLALVLKYLIILQYLNSFLYFLLYLATNLTNLRRRLKSFFGYKKASAGTKKIRRKADVDVGDVWGYSNTE